MQQLDVHTLLYMHKYLDGYMWELCALSFVPSLLYQDNATPLYWASRNGHHDVVQSLLGSVADVNIALIPYVSDVMLMPME